MKRAGITHWIITNSRRAAMMLLLAMTALTSALAEDVDPKYIPLTLEAIADGTTITVYGPKSGMQYSINGGTKTTLTMTDTSIPVSAGQKVQFYGNGTSIDSYYGTNIQCSNDCYIYGNIMSLVDETGYATNTTLTNGSSFESLFSGNEYLRNHPTHKLVLPATTLTPSCYASMFERCTSLTEAPELPARELYTSNPVEYCYSHMFHGCTGLTTAPDLPATTLAPSCYEYMFKGCTSLTTAPELPATTLETGCYMHMFEDCTSLTTAPKLPATTLKDDCYECMFYNCTSLTTAPELPATTLTSYCYAYMFRFCTNLSYVRCLATDISANNCTKDWLSDVAAQGTFVKAKNMNWGTGNSGIPSGWTVVEGMKGYPLTLQAIDDGTITVTDPKSGMQYSKNGGAKQLVTTDPISVSAGQTVEFYGNETYITSYDGTKIQSSADCYIYGNIMSLVDETGFATATTLTDNYSFESLFKDNTHLKNHSEKTLVLPATTLKMDCYAHMFEGCTSLTAAPELPATELEVGCYESMFYGCSGLAAAPELPAITLEGACYAHMFKGCTGLIEAPMLPATELKTGCYECMFQGCTNLSYVKCLATDIFAYDCTSDWLKDVAASGIFEKAEGMEDWTAGASGIPSGWMVVEGMKGYPLTLQAIGNDTKITVTNPKEGMQYSINGGAKQPVTTNPISVSAGQKVQFYGDGTNITSYNGTNIKCSADCYIYGNIMSLVDEMSYATATTLRADNTFKELFSGNAHLRNHSTHRLVMPATTLAANCYQAMFAGCSGLTTAPELPATTLLANCYNSMFDGCSNLNYVKCMATDISASNCTTDWLKNVAASGVFVKDENKNWPTGASGIPEGWMVVDGMRLQALTLEAIADGTITVYGPKSGMQYSINGGAKQPVTTDPISVSAGQTVQFYGNGKSITSYNGTKIGCSADCYIYGNIMSLLDETGFAAATTLTENHTFSGLFSGNIYLKNHPTYQLVLPATTLKDFCYIGMFGGCTGLTVAPELPATTLTEDCYASMFQGCTALTTAPELPATTMTYFCYVNMFNGCTSLTTAPELPATTLDEFCYAHMFEGCTSLTTAPELPATTMTYSCYASMFEGCTSLTTAPELPAITLETGCYAHMFEGCSGLTKAPVLPATELKTGCYKCMFNNCTNLNYVRCLATDIEADGFTSEWLKGVAASGTFVKAENANWTTGISGIPEGWTAVTPLSAPALTLEAIDDGTITVYDPKSGMQYSKNGGAKTAMSETTEITVLANDIVQFYGNDKSITSYNGTKIVCSADCYIYGNIMSLVDENDFDYNTTLTADNTFNGLFLDNEHLKNHHEKPLVLPATKLTKYCYNEMFSGCSGLFVAPDLPATELAEGCYASMFLGCTSLIDTPELPAPKLTKNCYKEMFRYCSGVNYVRCLATDISAEDCTTDWLSNVAPQGTFVKADGMTGWKTSASGIPEGWTIFGTMRLQPLTLEAIADGTITVYKPKEGMQYSIDGGTKTAITTTATTEIQVRAGQKVQFYGNGTSITQYGVFAKETSIQCSADCYIYGNIMSLVDEKGFATATTLTEEKTFRKLFYNDYYKNTKLKNHPNKPLVLPATTLSKWCYENMFRGCKGLTKAPELPAKTLAYSCYEDMFWDCTGLTEAPKLRATELETYCYMHMFHGCTGLTEAPELPATKLADDCYLCMFKDCTNLATAPELRATELATYCYEGMFSGCRSLTTAPELPATTLAPSCYEYMFNGCTSLTKAPELPATTLVEKCYFHMFGGCHSLNFVKCLATDISATDCTTDWLSNVASQGTFVKAKNANWSTGVSGIPEGWTAVGPNSITLYDTADNRATLETKNGQTMDYVVLDGRTLYKDGNWNTLCLPFNVSDFTGTPLEGADVRTLTAASFENGTLTLNFTPKDWVTGIAAGTPYLVKWTTTGTNLQNPIFYNVTIMKGLNSIKISDIINFQGTYASTTYDAEDRSILFLGADNTLYYPEAGATIGACRAYFQLTGGLTCGEPNNPNSIRAFNLNFGDDGEDTGITTTNFTNYTNSDAWYSTDGRKLQGKPKTKGIYIHQGRKVAIK